MQNGRFSFSRGGPNPDRFCRSTQACMLRHRSCQATKAWLQALPCLPTRVLGQNCEALFGEGFLSDFWCGRRRQADACRGGQAKKRQKDPPKSGPGSTPLCFIKNAAAAHSDFSAGRRSRCGGGASCAAASALSVWRQGVLAGGGHRVPALWPDHLLCCREG